MESRALGLGLVKVEKHDVCRLCMIEHEYCLSVFLANEVYMTSLGEFIRDLLNLEVSEGDGLPGTACSRCVEKLMEFRKFKEMCIHSEKELRRRVPTGGGELKLRCTVEGEGVAVGLMDGGGGIGCMNVEDESTVPNEACDPLAYDNLCLVKDEGVPMQLLGEVASRYQSYSVDCESGVPVIRNDLLLDPLSLKNETDTEEVYPRDPLGDDDDCPEEDTAEGECNEDAAVCSDLLPFVVEDQVDCCNNNRGPTKELEKESDKFVAERQGTSRSQVLKKPSYDPVQGENLQLEYSNPKIFVVDCFLETRVKKRKKDVKLYSSSKKFSQLNDRARPVRNHEREQLDHQAENTSCPTEYECNYCNMRYVEKNSLALHIKIHMGEMRSAIVLPEKDFQPRFSLNLLVKEFKCNECGKMFTKSRGLKRHSVIHTGVKRFKCNECGKMFTRKYSLKLHSFIHLGVKKFKCNVCEKMFTQRAHLKKHSVVHTRVKAFKCNVCGKMFTQRIHLNKHSVVHTRVKAFKCNECGKIFTHRSHLNKHSFIHTRVKAFK